MDTAFVRCNFLLDSVVRDISTTDCSEVNDSVKKCSMRGFDNLRVK